MKAGEACCKGGGGEEKESATGIERHSRERKRQKEVSYRRKTPQAVPVSVSEPLLVGQAPGSTRDREATTDSGVAPPRGCTHFCTRARNEQGEGSGVC